MIARSDPELGTLLALAELFASYSASILGPVTTRLGFDSPTTSKRSIEGCFPAFSRSKRGSNSLSQVQRYAARCYAARGQAAGVISSHTVTAAAGPSIMSSLRKSAASRIASRRGLGELKLRGPLLRAMAHLDHLDCFPSLHGAS